MSFGKEDSISSMMNDLKVESELSLVKVIAIDDIDETEIGGFKLEYKEAESKFDVPQWVASILVEKNLVKLADVGIDTELSTANNNEKMKGMFELSELKPEIYKRINFHLKNLRSRSNNDPVIFQESNKISTEFNDLINTRISKMVSIASLPETPDNIQKILTPEEYLLFNIVRSNIQEWRESILGNEL